ncbi:hypothetical protein VTN49DRAFT_7589 [Thermomyces lanuginosus]|uniref:uncharacterized protein n=1 Tax=Thermomyces lanuginosus TaxID=5541 RepID=UPI003742E3C3
MFYKLTDGSHRQRSLRPQLPPGSCPSINTIPSDLHRYPLPRNLQTREFSCSINHRQNESVRVQLLLWKLQLLLLQLLQRTPSLTDIRQCSSDFGSEGPAAGWTRSVSAIDNQPVRDYGGGSVVVVGPFGLMFSRDAMCVLTSLALGCFPVCVW